MASGAQGPALVEGVGLGASGKETTFLSVSSTEDWAQTSLPFVG